MAKVKAATDGEITLEFPRTGNAWIDAGIVGLYRVLNRKPSYVNSSAPEETAEDRARFPDVHYHELLTDRFVITGPASQVQACLEDAYNRMVGDYFNKSSAKQLSEKGTYNFYYDSIKDNFITFPKKKAVGAALLLFDKAARPSGTQVAWGDEDENKKVAGRLPPSHAHLQAKLNTFLTANKLKPGPPAGLLIDGPNQVKPKVEIKAVAKESKSNCFLSGMPESAVVDAKETAFPLFGGSRSFVNGNTDWPRIGWRADFVGKFVPALSFFYLQDDDIHVFFPESSSLKRVDEFADMLQRMVNVEPNLFRNFDFNIGGYVRGRSEVALAFLHAVFVKLSEAERVERAKAEEAAIDATGESISMDEDEPVKIEPLISAEIVFDAVQRQGSVGFAVVSAAKKGNVWMARDFWTFRDVVYLARLFDRMLTPVQHGTGKVHYQCSPKGWFFALYDFESKSSVLRDRVCEAIFRRESVLALLERHAFHNNTHTDSAKSYPVKPLLDFATLYEVELRKGTPMQESYANMVKTACWLGDTIGKSIAEAVTSKEENESRGRARGALFRLRKARTTGDFMNELARLQLRYDITVPPSLFDGATLSPESFDEFRGFCVVSALNRFLYSARPAKPQTPTS